MTWLANYSVQIYSVTITCIAVEVYPKECCEFSSAPLPEAAQHNAQMLQCPSVKLVTEMISLRDCVQDTNCTVTQRNPCSRCCCSSHLKHLLCVMEDVLKALERELARFFQQQFRCLCAVLPVPQEHCLTWEKGSSASWSAWLRMCLRSL